MTIPQTAIDAAAAALHKRFADHPSETPADYEDEALTALQAALPYLPDQNAKETRPMTIPQTALDAGSAADAPTHDAATTDAEKQQNFETVIKNFINQRPEYIDALQEARGNQNSDYHRWTGHAAARRQLAENLGWTVPHNPDDKTAPQEKQNH